MTDRLSTGIDGLDQLLSGGFLRGSCNMVEGVPGTGKTTLGLQFIHSGALAGEPGIIVTFEEFPRQIEEDALRLGWDLPELAATHRLRVICTSPQVFLDQLQDVDGLVESTLGELGARRILVDSVSHLAQLRVTASERRAMVYSMINGLKRAGLTSIITREVQSRQAEQVPFEEYLADSVVRLTYELEADNQRRRYIEVTKSRGGPHLSGKHMLDLTSRGATVYPRLAPHARDEVAWEGGLCRTPTGVPGLDEILGGGMVCGFSCLVAGSAGVGKTTLGLQFACQGAERGEPAVYVSFEESAAKLKELARGYGLPLARYTEEGSVAILHRSPIGAREEQLAHDLGAEVDRIGAKRVVLDSLTDLQMLRRPELNLRETVYSLVDALEARKVTSLLIAEVPELFGQTQVTGENVSIIVDGIVLLKYLEMEGWIQRAVSVLKMRGSDHDKGIRRFTITDAGMAVQGRFEGTEGLMVGATRATTIELAVRSFSESDARLNEELLQRFAALHPRVKPVPLNIPYNPDEAREVVAQAMSSAATSLSVLPLCLYWMTSVLDPQKLLPLNEIVPPDRWNDHLAGLVAPATVEGQLYAAPAIAVCGVLLYRRDLLEEHGFQAPPATWEELHHQASVICAGNPGLVGFEFPAYAYEGLSTTFLTNLWSNGGEVLGADGQVRLREENALQALTFLRDTIHTSHLAPVSVTTARDGIEPQRSFLEGHTVFLWMLPSVLQRTLQEDSPVRDRAGIAPPPIGPRGTTGHTYLGGWHYAVPRTANAPSAACDFISYMVSAEVQKERALRGGPLPTLKALYDDEDVLAFNPHYRDVKAILAASRQRERIPRYPEVSRILQRCLHPALQGRTEPASALEAAASEIAHLLQRG